MIISSKAILENIGWVLDHEIAPAVQQEPWLASYLRSISALLPLVGALVETECTILDADNADLRETLRTIAGGGLLSSEIAGVVDGSAAATMAERRDENDRLAALLDRCLPPLHADRDGPGIDAARAYMARSLERRRALYDALGPIPF